MANPDDFALRSRGIASTSDANWEDFQGPDENLAEDLADKGSAPDEKDEDFGIERF